MEYKKGYGYFINGIVITGEFLLLNISFIVAIYIFRNYLVDAVLSELRLVFLALNIAYLPTIFLNYQKFHEKRILFSHNLIENTLKISFVFFLSFTSLLMLLKIEDFSRLFLLSFSIAYFIILTCWWLFMWYCLKRYRKAGYNFKNVIIVGQGDNSELLIKNLTSDDNYGYRVLGYFSDLPARKHFSHPCLGNLHEVIPYLQNHKIDEFYCALPSEYMHAVTEYNRFCENHLIRFFFVPALSPLLARHMKMEMIGTSPVMVNRPEPLNDFFSRWLKRSFDLLFSGIMILLSPLWFLPIALLVKISSPGPVIFKQLRTGEGGKDFWCYKFRSMRVNADCDKVQATRFDPRKTKIGDFLRKTNLDELPQFFNIFKGDMSVVGPRPHMLKHTEDYSRQIDKYMVRHYVKPGLTGWAQVNGFRGETKENWQMKKRVECDIWYLENWSFWLDMKIIAQTGYKMFKHDDHAF